MYLPEESKFNFYGLNEIEPETKKSILALHEQCGCKIVEEELWFICNYHLAYDDGAADSKVKTRIRQSPLEFKLWLEKKHPSNREELQ